MSLIKGSESRLPLIIGHSSWIVPIDLLSTHGDCPNFLMRIVDDGVTVMRLCGGRKDDSGSVKSAIIERLMIGDRSLIAKIQLELRFHGKIVVCYERL